MSRSDKKEQWIKGNAGGLGRGGEKKVKRLSKHATVIPVLLALKPTKRIGIINCYIFAEADEFTFLLFFPGRLSSKLINACGTEREEGMRNEEKNYIIFNSENFSRLCALGLVPPNAQVGRPSRIVYIVGITAPISAFKRMKNELKFWIYSSWWRRLFRCWIFFSLGKFN